MKVIISHDVDHISVREHLFTDFFVPKLIIKNHISLFQGKLGFKIYFLKWLDLFKNKLNNIKELIEFDKENKIPSTFFIGVANDLNLNYSIENAKKWIKYIEKEGFITGVHGIDFSKYENMKKEFDIFKQTTSQKEFGIRMHYLRYDQNTYKILSKLGYSYDASSYKSGAVFFKDGIISFPCQIMDSYLMRQCQYSKEQLVKIKEVTKKRIEILTKYQIDYLSIIMHDIYFSTSYPLIYEWYIWLIRYLKEKDIKFINYHQAVSECLQKKTKC